LAATRWETSFPKAQIKKDVTARAQDFEGAIYAILRNPSAGPVFLYVLAFSFQSPGKIAFYELNRRLPVCDQPLGQRGNVIARHASLVVCIRHNRTEFYATHKGELETGSAILTA